MSDLRLFTLRLVLDHDESFESTVESLEPVLSPFRADVQDGWIEDLGAFALLRAWVVMLGEGDARELTRALVHHAHSRQMNLSFVAGVDPLPKEGWVGFDADSTLVDGEGIDQLASHAGAVEEVSSITARAMAGELDYASSLRERVRCLKGLPLSTLDTVVQDLQLNPGADEAVEACHACGWKVAVLSGGFGFYLDEVQRRLGVDRTFGNELAVEDGSLTGEVVGRILDAQGKAERLAELSPATVAIGDGANDAVMLEAAGVGIAFDPKPALLSHADGVCTRRDLRVAVALTGLLD